MPGGAAKRESVNAALVAALRSFGSLITAAVSIDPDVRALVVGESPAWRDLKEGIAAVSRVMDEALTKK